MTWNGLIHRKTKQTSQQPTKLKVFHFLPAIFVGTSASLSSNEACRSSLTSLIVTMLVVNLPISILSLLIQHPLVVYLWTWSQHGLYYNQTPLIAPVFRKSCWSRCHVFMSSMRCKGLDLGGIHELFEICLCLQ